MTTERLFSSTTTGRRAPAGRRLLVTLTVLLGSVPLAAGGASAQGAPSVTAQGSPSGYPVGVSVYDTVNVSGVGPSALLTFQLYGPEDAGCSGAPIFTSTKAITVDGYYESDRHTSVSAGTFRWIATYDDATISTPLTTTCADPKQEVFVSKRTPTLSPAASDGVVGGTITDTGILTTGAGPAGPTGTVTFSLYGPGNMTCAGAPIFTSSKAVTGNGTYTSDPYAPLVAGTYHWTSSYGGDANNNVAYTLCTDPAQASEVTASGDDPWADDQADVAFFRPSSGGWYVSGSTDVIGWGVPGDIPVAGDYDGDGRINAAVYRPSSGGWYIQGGSPEFVAWGVPGDIPVPDDYDGNGTTDVAVFRPANGAWYVRTASPTVVVWGVLGDIPVPGDYDGDGTTDIAVFRPADNTWYLHTASPFAVVWGAAGDIPVPGDYDGNGTADVSVFRPSTGVWYLRTASPYPLAWGQSGDIPVPGDYDGNGTTDVAVFRPAQGQWFLRTGTAQSLFWGTSTDIPLPLPHAIRQAFFS